MQVASQKAQRAQQVLQLQVRTSDKNIQCWFLKTKHCFKSTSLFFFFLFFMAAGFPAPAGEEEAAGGLCSASEGEGAARGALHLV